MNFKEYFAEQTGTACNDPEKKEKKETALSKKMKESVQSPETDIGEDNEERIPEEEAKATKKEKTKKKNKEPVDDDESKEDD